MSKQRKTKPVKQADSDSDEDTQALKQENEADEVLMVGGADEMGGYDENNFDGGDEQKKKKSHNFVRK